MAWTIEFAPSAAQDLEKLDSAVRKRILKFLYERVAPIDAKSKLGEFWKYRVGDSWIICQIEDHAIRILVAKTGRRSDIYG